MTLYELMNNTTIQSNVELRVFNPHFYEEQVAYYRVRCTADLQCEQTCDGKDIAADEEITIDLEELEDYEVNYIYGELIDGEYYVVIEIECQDE